MLTGLALFVIHGEQAAAKARPVSVKLLSKGHATAAQQGNVYNCGSVCVWCLVCLVSGVYSVGTRVLRELHLQTDAQLISARPAFFKYSFAEEKCLHPAKTGINTQARARTHTPRNRPMMTSALPQSAACTTQQAASRDEARYAKVGVRVLDVSRIVYSLEWHAPCHRAPCMWYCQASSKRLDHP